MAEQIIQIPYLPGEMNSVYPTPHLNLPDIREVSCHEPKDGGDYWLFKCEETELRNRVCPKCGSIHVYIHGTMKEPRVVHDVRVGTKQVDISLAVKRYRCEDCGRTFNREFNSVMKNRQMTYRLYDLIRKEAFERPFSDVALDYGYSDTTIAEIFDEYATELEEARGPVVAPRVLGIDEKHIVKAMRATFVDIETGTLLEMTETNTENDITKTIESMVDYDKKIKIVTMDMANGYRAYVQACLPNAKIVVDKFHVFQDLDNKIGQAKTKIMAAIGKQIDAETDFQRKDHMYKVRQLVIRNSRLFVFGQKKLQEKGHRLAAMADICDTFPEFNHLRLLKERFEQIYTCKNRASAEAIFDDWQKLVPPKGSRQIIEWEKRYGVSAELFADFCVFRNAMKNWRTEVFNYFEPGCSVTNAAAEGLNNLIGRINSQGNGYSFKRLRAKALFFHLAVPKVQYRIKKDVQTSSQPQRSGSGNTMGLRTGRIFNETIQYSIVAEEVPSKRKPLSVFSYLERDEEDT